MKTFLKSIYQPPGSPEPAGGWIWVSGEPVTYTNWIAGEPNNNNRLGPQNWANIWPPQIAVSAPEQWNDTWDLPDSATLSASTLIGIHGVVEVVPPTGIGTPTNSTINAAVEIGWPSQAGKYYRVQWSPAVGPAVWRDLSGPLRGTGPTSYFFDTTRAAPERFYRVLTLP